MTIEERIENLERELPCATRRNRRLVLIGISLVGGICAVAWAITRWPEANLNAAGWAFIVGIVIFSGTLYLLSVTGLRWLGAITPIGGLAFLAGWAILVWSINR